MLVGELLAAPHGHDANALREQVCAAVEYAAQRRCEGNGAALGRLLGVPKNTVWEWLAGTAIPQVRLLLRLAQVLGVSLRQLVLGPLPAGDAPASSDGWRKSVLSWRGSPEGERQAATRVWEPVRQTLCNEVASSATEGASASLRTVAVRVGVPVRSVYQRFPELARGLLGASGGAYGTWEAAPCPALARGGCCCTQAPRRRTACDESTVPAGLPQGGLSA